MDSGATDDSVFGPKLPPHLANRAEPEMNPAKSVIGPFLPSHDLLDSGNTIAHKNSQLNDDGSAQDHIDIPYGPIAATDFAHASQSHIDLEERKLEMLSKNLDNIPDSSKNNREEWMLELPEVRKPSILPNNKRSFYQGRDATDFSDRSSWTDVAGSKKSSSSSSAAITNSIRCDAKAVFDRERDKQQDDIAKKHKKKHKHSSSLLEQHRRKQAKDKRDKEKDGVKPVRRPFDRELDMQAGKVDRHHLKHIVDKSKLLNTKFSNGGNKYL